VCREVLSPTPSEESKQEERNKAKVEKEKGRKDGVRTSEKGRALPQKGCAGFGKIQAETQSANRKLELGKECGLLDREKCVRSAGS